MNAISPLSGGPQKLTSQRKVSMESAQKQPAAVEASPETKKIENFEIKMQEVDKAFALQDQIRILLETQLNNILPKE